MKQFTWLFGLFGLVLLAGAVAAVALRFKPGRDTRPDSGESSLTAAGSLSSSKAAIHFGRDTDDPYASPTLTEIAIPIFPGSHAIWGALGQDQQGQIWFGVSANAGPNASAQLFSYDPSRGVVRSRGDVISQLEQAGKRRANECQMKIHSRIVQAADGYLYFTSMDEQGEQVDGSRPPDWGSHLWRLHPTRDRWEHLAAVPEALIAVSGMGRYVYALGYFDHILYQYDTVGEKIRRIRVGSAGGHISRNFLSDPNEHVYVPSVALHAANATAGEVKRFQVELVELDASLTEVGRTPLLHYGATLDDSSHGITGFVHMADGSIVFATHEGLLYLVQPRRGAAAVVTNLGWFHPEGTAYAASMFTFSGQRYVVGVGQRSGKPYEWLVYDLEERTNRAVPLRLTDPSGSFNAPYGSNVQDTQECFYVAGSAGGLPKLFRVHRGDSAATLANPATVASSPLATVAPDASVPPQASTSAAAALEPNQLGKAILQATAQDWLGATVAEQQAMSRLIADWLQPGASEKRRQEWAQRYYQLIDSLARTPQTESARIVDWLPLVHGMLSQPETQDTTTGGNETPKIAP